MSHQSVALVTTAFVALAGAVVVSCVQPKERAVPGAESTASTEPIVPIAAAQSWSGCLVESNGIARVRIGMTLESARAAIPDAQFKRASDGDGAALVAVKRDTVELMTISALEDDAEAPIDWTKTVHSIETFHPSCRTATGIHPGAKVDDLVPVLGNVLRIVESEIESRQFVTYEQQPEWMTLRIDYTGKFAPGKRETIEYDPKARIFSLAVSK